MESNLDSTDNGGKASNGMPLTNFSLIFLYLTFSSSKADTKLTKLLFKFLLKIENKHFRYSGEILIPLFF